MKWFELHISRKRFAQMDSAKVKKKNNWTKKKRKCIASNSIDSPNVLLWDVLLSSISQINNIHAQRSCHITNITITTIDLNSLLTLDIIKCMVSLKKGYSCIRWSTVLIRFAHVTVTHILTTCKPHLLRLSSIRIMLLKANYICKEVHPD